MNTDIIEGKWTQLKGAIQETWGDLTDDDLDRINGDRQQLAGKLQERYGWAKNDAETAINNFVDERRSSFESADYDNANIRSI